MPSPLRLMAVVKVDVRLPEREARVLAQEEEEEAPRLAVSM